MQSSFLRCRKQVGHATLASLNPKPQPHHTVFKPGCQLCQSFLCVIGDLLEMRNRTNPTGFLWDAQASLCRCIDKQRGKGRNRDRERERDRERKRAKESLGELGHARTGNDNGLPKNPTEDWLHRWTRPFRTTTLEQWLHRRPLELKLEAYIVSWTVMSNLSFNRFAASRAR